MQLRTRKWLALGIGVKRYIALILLGTVLAALALAMFLAFVYRTVDVPETAGPVVYTVTLQFIPHPWRELGIGLVGVAIAALSTFWLFKSVLSVVIAPGEDVAEILYRGRRLRRGPRTVGIGGGTGMGTLLRGLKEHTSNLTAVVTVADDGGSSGRLRRDMGLVAPGDIRSCLTALADSEALMTKLVDYRFEEGLEIQGHSLGNLLLAALQDIEGGLDPGIDGLSRVLRIRGNIAPSTMSNVNLAAELQDGRVVVGESRISSRGRIRRVFLVPRKVAANDDAVAAILAADLIVIGPGSVYTSIVPNLLVNEITAAIRASDAVKIFVCNVATEPGETDDFSVRQHIDVVEQHAGRGTFDHLLVNSRTALDFADGPPPHLLRMSEAERREVRREGIDLTVADVIDEERPMHHNSERLAQSILDIYRTASSLGSRSRARAVTQT
ncbi:MAG: YvcK family protein [Chloroflexi bacterium]|nr:YvcK family protein [Chloroflexota bacterium]MCY3939068.1 YvcK family protein [Chloroflexota bacterium]